MTVLAFHTPSELRQVAAGTSGSHSCSRRSSLLVRATAEVQHRAGPSQNGSHSAQNGAAVEARPAAPAQAEAKPQSRFHVIQKSRWHNGIPPVMGAHLMASDSVAPISTSKSVLEGSNHMFYYPEEEHADFDVSQYASFDAAAQGIADLVERTARASIKEKGAFTLVLSGGSLFKALKPLIGLKDMDWSKWHVSFVDERHVPLSSGDSNFKGADDAFLSKTSIPREQVLTLRSELSVAEAAKEYEGQLLRLDTSILPRNNAGLPVFDVILLGIGPDGHVASLFPNSHQLSVKEDWVFPVSDSPKPPPERITYTLPVINSGKEVVVAALGAGKAEIVQRALEVQALPGAIPAQLVRPTHGNLHWILDVASAAELSSHKWQQPKAFPRSQ